MEFCFQVSSLPVSTYLIFDVAIFHVCDRLSTMKNDVLFCNPDRNDKIFAVFEIGTLIIMSIIRIIIVTASSNLNTTK